jgi:hypothetical protein
MQRWCTDRRWWQRSVPEAQGGAGEGEPRRNCQENARQWHSSREGIHGGGGSFKSSDVGGGIRWRYVHLATQCNGEVDGVLHLEEKLTEDREAKGQARWRPAAYDALVEEETRGGGLARW